MHIFAIYIAIFEMNSTRNYNFGVVVCLLFLVFSPYLNAQNSQCHTDLLMKNQEKVSTNLRDAIEKGLKNFISKKIEDRGVLKEVSIPVHITIIHTPRQAVGTGDNLSLDVIKAQLDVLNRDFNRFNKDSIKTPSVFKRSGMDIYFCLAKVDPFGGATDGITRYPSSISFSENEFAIKEATGWPRSDYLNIYVTKLEEGNSGFAYIPSTETLPDEILDGVVINVNNFGGNESDYTKGRTLVHEVGHFLGLKHIWGEDGCDNDDGFADTPLQDTANLGCPIHPKISCDSIGDMFMNYMDYSADSCINAFTPDQVAYMSEILNTSRFALTVSNKAPECTKIPPLRIVGISRVLPKCTYTKNGTLELLVTGGVPPYKYFLNNTAQDSSLFKGLGGGNYLLKIVDASGRKDSLNFFLFEPDTLKIKIPSIFYSGCTIDTDSISAQLSASGGTIGPQGYNYTFGNIGSNNTGLFTKISPGNYKLLVKDFNQCTDSVNVKVHQRKFLNKIPETLTQPSCNNINDGEYKVTVVDSLKTYRYQFNNVASTIPTYKDLSPNMYNFVIRDSFGCIFQRIIEITNPPKLLIDSVVITEMPCYFPDTGRVIFYAIGGTPPYIYSLGNGFRSTPNFLGNGSGRFIGTVKDSRNCTTIFEKPINIKQVGGMEISVLKIDAFCENNPSGRIVMNALGGSNKFNFYLNGNRTANDIANLLPGFYQATIEDDVSKCSQTLNLNIGLQDPMFAEIDTVVKKENGLLQVSFNVSGGKPPYQYSLDGGTTFKTVPIFDNVKEGNFNLLVFDASNCQISKPFFLTSNKELESFGVNIFPNPSTGQVFIRTENEDIDQIEIELYNQSGQRVSELSYFKYTKEKYMMELDLQSLPNSIYFIKLAYRNKTIVSKVIKI